MRELLKFEDIPLSNKGLICLNLSDFNEYEEFWIQIKKILPPDANSE